MLLQVFLSEEQDGILFLKDFAFVLLFIDLLVQLIDFLLIYFLLLLDLLFKSIVLLVPEGFLLFFFCSEAAELF